MVDAFHGAGTGDMVVFAGLSVVVAEGRSHVVIYVQTLADGVDIVIGTTAFQTAFEQSVNQLFIGHIQTNNGMDFGTAFLQKKVKSLGLIDGAWKTVKNHTFGSLGVGVKLMLKNRNHEVVGDKMSFGYIAVGNLAKVGSLTDVATKNIASGYVIKPVLVDEACALGAFAAAGGTEHHYVIHIVCVVMIRKNKREIEDYWSCSSLSAQMSGRLRAMPSRSRPKPMMNFEGISKPT